jgi:hypothetical protein
MYPETFGASLQDFSCSGMGQQESLSRGPKMESCEAIVRSCQRCWLTSRRNRRIGNPAKFHLFAGPMVNGALMFRAQVSNILSV